MKKYWWALKKQCRPIRHHQDIHSFLPKLIYLYLGALVFIGCFNQAAVAQHTTIPNVEITQPNSQITKDPAVVSGTRLSEWLLESQKTKTIAPIKTDAKKYPLGTSWYTPAEFQAQTDQKNTLLQTLDSLPTPSGEPSFDQSRATLRSLIEKMPVTGRVVLPSADPRYLEVQPKLNPILGKNDRVRVPLAPSSITVIRTDGVLCKVRYQPNVEALSLIHI